MESLEDQKELFEIYKTSVVTQHRFCQNIQQNQILEVHEECRIEWSWKRRYKYNYSATNKTG